MESEGTKVFFRNNLLFLRKRKKFSQEHLAKLLGFTRSKYTALENGQTENPLLADLIKISEFFSISVDRLLKTDLSYWSEYDLRKMETGGREYINGKNLRVLSITVTPDNRENMEYVPIKAKAGYSAGYADPEFLAALPKFSLPNLPSGGTYRMFPTTGDSMLPIPEGSEVVARYVQDWKTLNPATLCIVILRGEQDFVFKEVTVQKNGTLLLRSFNKNYAPYTVEANEVLEIWRYVKHQTDKLPEPETDLQEIKKMLADMQHKWTKE
ncbi:helix-turn-helix domain-containing protein [Olivibacter sp. SDN3]|uniref:helix-turn-helix domain-containing protein n=1 Tax=Olivibacter sp. SDN3 TaxID=2764720 RepID=UPI0016514B94|nr:helix-turn-helix domain-containing protein [Olivibacter sp. SDN3]QNL47844.1 helix-turn-helix domain-containing protein [Olivibacter sp. SDN3]